MARQSAGGESPETPFFGEAFVTPGRRRAHPLVEHGIAFQYRAIERGDGKLALMQGGDQTPLSTFDVSASRRSAGKR